MIDATQRPLARMKQKNRFPAASHGWVFAVALFVSAGWDFSLTGASPTPSVASGDVRPRTREILGNSFSPRVTDDGRYVVFLSDANHLATNDLNRASDVFLKDRDTGHLKLISESTVRGVTGSALSFNPQISGDGRFILFESQSTNLVANDTNACADVFLRDVQLNVTHLVSHRREDTTSANGESRNALLSRDGRFIVFESLADNLDDPVDTNGTYDVFLYDHQSGYSRLISLNSDGTASANGESASPSVSVDGRYVVFETQATNVSSIDTNTGWDIVVRDTVGQSNLLVSVSQNSVESGLAPSLNPIISADGKRVAFTSSSPNLAPGVDRNSVFLRDLELQTTHVASLSHDAHFRTNSVGRHLWDQPPAITPDGRFIACASATNIYLFDGASNSVELITAGSDGISSANGVCRSPRISDDGRFVAFLSSASNLFDEAVNGEFQVYLRDRKAGTTRLVSRGPHGSASNDCAGIDITPNGRWLVFESPSDQLVDDDQNHASDVFLYDAVTEFLERVSTGELLTQPGVVGGWSVLGASSMSSDARFLAYAFFPENDSAQPPEVQATAYVSDLITASREVINLNTNGIPSAPGVLGRIAISPDGRYAAFASQATDLVGGVSEEFVNLYVRDRVTRVTRLVPHSARRAIDDANSRYRFYFAGGGHYLIHESIDVVDSTRVPQIYAFDTQKSTNLLVSRRHDGIGPSRRNSYLLGGSPTATRMVFISGATNLDATGRSGYFVYDLEAHSTRRIASLPAADWPRILSMQPDTDRVGFSADGRFIALVQKAVEGTRLVRINLDDDSILDIASRALRPSVSERGDRIAYESRESATSQIWVWDEVSGTSTLISESASSGEEGNGDSTHPALTPDGNHVLFRSRATDLLTMPTLGVNNLYMRDMDQGSIVLLTPALGPSAFANGLVGRPWLSGDGRTAVFETFADNLVPGDVNRTKDILVLRLRSLDSDADGLDDDWELAYFGELLADGFGDFDGDGVSNLAEFIAGTDPTNRDLYLRVFVSRSAISGARTVYWVSSPGRLYRVLYRDNLRDGPWLPAGPVVRAVSRESFIEDTSEVTSEIYYRVQVVE